MPRRWASQASKLRMAASGILQPVVRQEERGRSKDIESSQLHRRRTAQAGRCRVSVLCVFSASDAESVLALTEHGGGVRMRGHLFQE